VGHHLLTRGATAVADAVNRTDLHERPSVLVFDELHMYPKWKSFLKGLDDAHGEQCRMIVTGGRPGGLGDYGLFYLRDKAKREVDFLVTKDGKPWLRVEVKSAAQRDLNPNLAFFQHATGAKHAFQAVFDMPYVDRDCFALTMPIRVPVTTLLSQLP